MLKLVSKEGDVVVIAPSGPLILASITEPSTWWRAEAYLTANEAKLIATALLAHAARLESETSESA